MAASWSTSIKETINVQSRDSEGDGDETFHPGSDIPLPESCKVLVSVYRSFNGMFSYVLTYNI